MNCDVLLIGGHSTSGKSTIAQRIGRRLGFPVMQVDDLRLTLLDV
jgi:2-phosphoglycerate kinase